MTAITDIFTAVADKLQATFPGYVVYIGQNEDRFERPALLVECPDTYRRRLNIGVDETEIYLTVTIYERLSAHRNGDQSQALRDQQKALDLFRWGVLEVDGRSLPIEASGGGQSRGESYVDITVTLRDSVGYDPEKGVETMEKVNAQTGITLDWRLGK